MLNFDDYRYKGLKFYRRVARALQNPDDLAYADRLVTCVMHVLRDRLSLEESLRFISFLPMHVKGVYAHGWKINNDSKKLSSVEEFVNALRIKYPLTAGRKPGNDESFRNDVRAVFSVIHTDLKSKGVEDVKSFLPEVLHEFLPHPENDKPVVEVITTGGKHFPEIQPIKNEV